MNITQSVKYASIEFNDGTVVEYKPDYEGWLIIFPDGSYLAFTGGRTSAGQTTHGLSKARRFKAMDEAIATLRGLGLGPAQEEMVTR